MLLIKPAIYIMLLTVITKFLGFGREIALSSSFGTSALSDSYVLSIAIPGFFFTIISSAINSTFIPTIVGLDCNNKRNQFSSGVINFFFILIAGVVFTLYTQSHFFVDIYAGNLPKDVKSIAEGMLKVTCFSLFFRIIVAILNSYLQFQGFYIINTLLGLPLNIIIILSIFMASEDNYEILSYGFLFAMISQLVIVIPYIFTTKFKYYPRCSLSDFDIRKYSGLLLFVVAGVAINEINMLVDINVASGLGVGYVSSINYALKLNVFIQAVFVSSLVLVFFPNISKLAQGGNIEQSQAFFKDGVGVLIFILLPISFFSFLFSGEIVKLVYYNGEFDEFSIKNTSDALRFYSIGFLFFGLRELLIKTYYAINDMKTPMWNTFVGVTLNILLTVVLSKFMGIGGIALATSLSSIFICGLLICNIRVKRKFSLSFGESSHQFLLILLSSVISLLIVFIIGEKIDLGIPVLMSFYFLLYYIISLIFKVDLAETLFFGVKNKIWK